MIAPLFSCAPLILNLILVLILAFVFAVITPLLYVAVFGAMGEIDPMTEEMLSGYVNAKGQFFGAFSLGEHHESQTTVDALFHILQDRRLHLRRWLRHDSHHGA